MVALAGHQVLAPAPLNERRESHDARWLSFVVLIILFILCCFLFLSCLAELQLRKRG
jgi:hypothetical protein